MAVPKNKGSKEAIPSTTKASSFYSSYLEGKEVYILLTMIALACWIVFKDFLELKKVYLFKDIGSDSINIYFPGIAQMSEYMRTNGTPTWTFSQGLGQNIFPFWLSDFFSNALMFLCNKNTLPYGLAFIEVIKIFLCGFVFFKYLKELKVDSFSALLGAFLFSFCGYIIVGGCWTIFSVEALYAVLILYGFERFLNHGKWFWYVFGLSCLSFLQPFFLFMYAIVLLVYIPVRYNERKENEWKQFPLFILKIAGLSVLAVAISAYQLFPDILQYLESPRVGGEASFINKLKAQPMFSVTDDLLRFTTTFRAFGNDMLGTGNKFQGWQNYLEAPLFYCGIFCLVAFPQVFFSFSKKQKIGYGILTVIFVLPLFFPFFRYTFWAYSGDYFRTFSLVITLFLLIFTVKAIDHISKTEKINKVVLGVTVFFLLFLLYTPAAQFKPAINQGLRTMNTLLLFVYAGLLWGLSQKGSAKNSYKIAILVICFLELVFVSNTTVNKRDVVTRKELSEKVGYNDYTVDAISYIKKTNSNFYRVNKDYSSGQAMHASINDAKVQGFYGTPSYFSFNQKNYIKFLGDLKVINPKDENETRWAKGLGERPLLFTLVSGQYWLSKRPVSYLKGYGYDSLTAFGDVKVYKNRYALPLGFTYKQVLDETTFKKLSLMQKDFFLLRACFIGDEDLDLLSSYKKFNLADTTIPFSFDAYGQYVKDLKKDSLTITGFKENKIQGEITAASPEILFFSIPFDEGWKGTVNGKDSKLYRINGGLTGLEIPAGKNTVTLTFEPRFVKQGLWVTIFSLLIFLGLSIFSYFRNNSKLPFFR